MESPYQWHWADFHRLPSRSSLVIFYGMSDTIIGDGLSKIISSRLITFLGDWVSRIPSLTRELIIELSSVCASTSSSSSIQLRGNSPEIKELWDLQTILVGPHKKSWQISPDLNPTQQAPHHHVDFEVTMSWIYSTLSSKPGLALALSCSSTHLRLYFFCADLGDMCVS